MATKRVPNPRDPLALANPFSHIVTRQVTGWVEDGKDPATSELRRLGDLRRAGARVDRLTAQRRIEIARADARARYTKKQ